MLVATIDENGDLLDLLTAALEYADYTAATLAEVERAGTRLRALEPDAILLNVWTYPRDRGWQLLRDLQADPTLRAVPVIVYSSDCRDLEAHAELLRRGSCQTLLTPFHLADLYAALQRATRAAPSRHVAVAPRGAGWRRGSAR